MTHASETGAISRLHFPGAGFRYVCHANLGPDSSGTRFRRRLEHCSISKPETGVHVTEMMICDWSLVIPTFYVLLVASCKLSCCNLITNLRIIRRYVAFSHVYFWRLKFSSRSIMQRKTGARFPDESIYMAPVSGACVMYLRDPLENEWSRDTASGKSHCRTIRRYFRRSYDVISAFP